MDLALHPGNIPEICELNNVEYQNIILIIGA